MCVRDGKGWTANSMQPGQAQDMLAQTVVAIMVNTDAFGPIHDYATRGDSSVVKSVELVGKMAVDGVQCYALKVTFKAGGEAKVYLGKKDKLLVRADLGDNGTMRYSFYEKRHGVQIPTVTEISNAMGSMTGRLTKFEVNYPMDGKLLKRP